MDLVAALAPSFPCWGFVLGRVFSTPPIPPGQCCLLMSPQPSPMHLAFFSLAAPLTTGPLQHHIASL
eukprot:10739912-Prorocentrum_lima.AAC.1